MYQFKYTLIRCSLKRVYFKYIRPIIEYADTVWAGRNVINLDELEIVKKDAAGMVTSTTARCSTTLLIGDTDGKL